MDFIFCIQNVTNIHTAIKVGVLPNKSCLVHCFVFQWETNVKIRNLQYLKYFLQTAIKLRTVGDLKKSHSSVSQIQKASQQQFAMPSNFKDTKVCQILHFILSNSFKSKLHALCVHINLQFYIRMHNNGYWMILEILSEIASVSCVCMFYKCEMINN